jgi:hypothetical protein
VGFGVVIATVYHIRKANTSLTRGTFSDIFISV